MEAILTRDSVCAADDMDAPHKQRCVIPDACSWEDLTLRLLQDAALPRIAGGTATWTLASNIPIAVAAQQWEQPRLLRLSDTDWDRLATTGNPIRFHWSYCAQLDPDVVFEALDRVRFMPVTN
ncbi:MAG: hypothetical protein AAF432_03670 [Planctomycetota bacterium]